MSNFILQATSPDESAIVLVHGFGAGVFAWRHVMQPLADSAGCRVIAFDRPAFGQFLFKVFSLCAHSMPTITHIASLLPITLLLCQVAAISHALHRCLFRWGHAAVVSMTVA